MPVFFDALAYGYSSGMQIRDHLFGEARQTSGSHRI